MRLSEVETFFQRYAEAFSAGDGEAVAALWHAPSLITDTRDGTARVTCWADAEPMRANMVALCGAYAHAGPHRWLPQVRRHTPMGANHAFALVDWTMQSPDGTLLQQFSTGYQLARFADGPQVLTCTAYDENLNDFRATHAPQ